jgi:plastocyanin
VAAGVVAAALVVGGSGCDLVAGDEPDLVAGKQMFVERCGACHQLARADTQGTAGPDLDAALQRPLEDGFGRDGIQGMVRQQIAHPMSGLPGEQPGMPADIVTGRDAESVAAYVAFAAAREGEDEGLLAEAVQRAGGGEPIAAENGVLTIPADPGGQLAYVTSEASAEAGELTVRSPNESSVPHDIVLEQDGEVLERGEIVQDGGVSELRTTVQTGEYVFFCSVEGHREAGMEGTLKVE